MRWASRCGSTLDRIERQSSSLSNTSCLFAWVWAWSPDDIPTASDYSILDRPPEVRGRPTLPEGCPREEGQQGPQFRVLIHLDETRDYTPLDDRQVANGDQWPHPERFRWFRATEDGQPGPGRRPASPPPQAT